MDFERRRVEASMSPLARLIIVAGWAGWLFAAPVWAEPVRAAAPVRAEAGQAAAGLANAPHPSESGQVEPGQNATGQVTAPGQAEPGQAELQTLAARMAERLAALCPAAARDAVQPHTDCATALRDAAFMPFAANGVLFGGDQPDSRLSKKQLTHLSPNVFQFLYLSLFTFTGRWSASLDEREHVGVIRIEAYFRNAMPPGEFPYPFWHSADKWNAYETANELKFYLNHDGRIFVVTRSKGGSEANRGEYAHVTPPAFDGQWQWVDDAGRQQPHASLFSNRYDPANPWLAPLDDAYRKFATEARRGSCLQCHSPNNEAGMNHLVLLQTPLHAAGEIDNVLNEVRKGEMPQDDLGLRKDIPPALRDAILRTGEAFRGALRDADQWEAKQHHW